ncbi:MAG: ABC transporter ATP-binding protein [Rhizobiales bacterium]|nr:ABC transporter ATP-binding protein [Hyphomicrobiales bacterium]
MLTVEGVCKSYGPLDVLKRVTFSVEAGEMFAIIGPNGAGKTTLFKTMTGESLANAGAIVFDGEDVTHRSAEHRVVKGMGRTFQVARVFGDFSVLENAVVTIESRRRAAGEALGGRFAIRPSESVLAEASALIADLGLSHVRDKTASLLSHGDKKRLEFMMALALKPKILMLDEPTAGMSPADRIGIAKLIKDMQAAHNLTIVMTEHDMDIVFGLADRVMVLNYGEIIAVGAVAEIRANAAVADVYLGKEMYHA